ncbi:MAG: ABC transporter permease [Alphaproteobacteria bacterium]|nr:ABC transporter permease [Alphaproteobacteria bacterium]
MQMVPVLIGVSLVAFLSIHLVPGDPVQIMMHGRATEEVLATVRGELGLDRPLPIQYLRFVGGAMVGDLGKSIIQKAPVDEIIGERLGPSLFLLVYSAVLAVVIALPLAVVAALKAEGPIDHGIRIVGIIGFAMPPFWVGLLLMVLFGLVLRWFPISGYGRTFIEHLWHLFLPSLTIAAFLAPILVQSLRSAMLDVMTADYIEVARAKGLSRRRIVLKHVLRNAAIPVITVLAVNIGWLLGGAVVVEYVFAFPGLGSLLVRAVGHRDYPVIQGLSLVFAVIVMVINLLADLSYMAIDRRVLRR